MADERRLGRLLPRHVLPAALTIRWNTDPRRPDLWGPANKRTEGVIRNLSLNGALIEVNEPSRTNVGDHVVIKFGERSGVVKVHHVTPADSDHGVLFGVSFVETTELEDQFDIVIQHLRGRRVEKLSEDWRQAP